MNNSYKIGIMTWFQYHNYGTALQVTAISNVILKNGYEPFVINYNAQNIPLTLKAENILKETGAKVIKKLKNRTYRSYSNYEREKMFLSFYDKHLKFTNKCDLLSDLQRLNTKIDAFVCGSDQIWAPSCFDSHYFLDFVSDENKKIAYAPSVGLPSIEDKYIKSQMKQLTKKIGFLSTREESGSKIIADLCDREVKTVLDPTLLLTSNEWKGFYSENSINENKPFLLVYMLGKNEWQWKEIYSIAKKLNLVVRIIPVFEKDLKREGCIKEAIGPEEFLAYVNNADYICTDSFHGLAFSVNFHKQFTVFERFKTNDKINQNSRIYNLLDKFNLRSRLFKNKSAYKMLNEKIDYIAVDKRRNVLVNESMEYLKSALAKATSSAPQVVKNNIHNNNSLCCGCGACKAVCPCEAIEIRLNKEGFYTAFVNDVKCVSCGKCAKICPYMIERDDKLIADSELYSFKSKSNDVLKKSSSGGAAHHIASLLSEKGYAVAGCTFDVESQTAKHIIVEHGHSDELSKLQGSKYMQSNFSAITEQLYKSDVPTVIFGTPCQIAGMRSLLKNKNNIIYVDLICHGVPSYNLFKKYQEYLKEQGYDTTNLKIIFRNKEYGWHKRYITLNDGKIEKSFHQNKDPFFLSFEQCFCFSHSCYECPWRDKSVADIRIGDYWGKRFENDEKGVSEVIIISEKGKSIIDDISKKGLAEIRKQDVADYTKYQQTINSSEPVFWNAYIHSMADTNTKMDDILKKYIYPYALRKKLRQSASKIYQTVKDRKR